MRNPLELKAPVAREDPGGRPHLSVGSLLLIMFAVLSAATAQLMLKHGMQLATARAHASHGSLVTAAATTPWVLLGLTVLQVANPTGQGVKANLVGLLYMAVPLFFFFVGREILNDSSIDRLLGLMIVLGMIAGAIGRRNQQEENVDVFAVEAREIDPRLRERDRRDQAVYGRMLGMRHGHAHADPVSKSGSPSQGLLSMLATHTFTASCPGSATARPWRQATS